jgi:hypothetical protein
MHIPTSKRHLNGIEEASNIIIIYIVLDSTYFTIVCTLFCPEPRPGSQTAFEEHRGGARHEDGDEDDEEEEEEEEEHPEPRFIGRGITRPGINANVKFEPPTVPVIFVIGISSRFCIKCTIRM